MKAIDAQSAALAVNGQLAADPNIMITHVSTDTRTLGMGSLFVAIKGERVDGHDFARQAVEAGAVLVLAEKGRSLGEDIPALYVEDTVAALGLLAAYHRSRFHIPVVAVTGSVGKTSTKEIIASTLSAAFSVHKTRGNFNNEIGLPLSVLELDDSHQAAVFEMGMRGFGEISYLSKIVKPDMAVVTNIGISHIERLGSRQNIMKAKMEILDGMEDTGTVILNGDDDMLSGLRGLLKQETLLYGVQEDCDLYAFDVSSRGEEGVCFQLQFGGQTHDFMVPAPGMHHVHNGLAAITVALRLGMTPDQIKAGLMSYSGERLRMHIEEKDGIKVINDAYNAAPASMCSALGVLVDISIGRRSLAVLGDMLELGDWTEHAHKDIGNQVAQSGIHMLIAVGEYARWYAEGALEGGMSHNSVVHFENGEATLPFLREQLKRGDVILFKGSRRMKLDVLADELFRQI